MIDVNQEDPTKMIISQIRRFMRESDVKTLVEKFGSINELNIVRDKRTGESRGYCFITFSNRSSAQAAHEALHLKINLPTMNRPIEVCNRENKNIVFPLIRRSNFRLNTHY